MTLQEIIEEAGYETRSYSGRGMYGRSCLGVTIDRDHDLMDFIADVLEHASESEDISLSELADSFRGAKTDSMGLGTILYFPDVAHQDEPAEEGDEE
ncbi:MAG: hypothetical protein ACYDHY_06915 [Acidiferrobacterales bacterium]